jgi:type II restriction enzyme
MRSTIGVPVLKHNVASSQLMGALLGGSDQLDQGAMVFRMGVANAADAGIDMWSNFGPGFQTKHIELNGNELKEISKKFTGEKLVVVVRSVSSEVADQLVDNKIAIGSKMICVITLGDLQNLLDELIAIDFSKESEFRTIVAAEVAMEFGGHEGLMNLELLGKARNYW